MVSGPCAGQVWHDYCAGDSKLAQQAPSFAAWYEQQLPHMLRELLWGELARATESRSHTHAPHHDLLLRRATLFDEPTVYLGGLEGHLLMPLYQGLSLLARQRLRNVQRAGYTVYP